MCNEPLPCQTRAMELAAAQSLSQTIDRVNQAYFYDALPGKKERAQATRVILSCAGTPNSYGNTFGLTKTDERSRTHTFTGEGLTSPASRRHIHAEEACRCLIILNGNGSHQLSELGIATESLLGSIQRGESKGALRGTFCCGPCTVSLWRHMSVGGFGAYAKHLNAGLAKLEAKQDGKGSWRSFPFFYTLSALAEVRELPNAKRALKYALPECEKRVAKLRPSSEFSRRRRDLLLRVLGRSA
jgi:hypothetical protein